VQEKAKAEGVKLAASVEEDALINGLFAQVGWKFLVNRGNPSAFEAAPDAQAFAAANAPKAAVTGNNPAAPASPPHQPVETYTVNVDGRNFNVAVGPGGAALAIQPITATHAALAAPLAGSGAVIEAPMAGNILKIQVEVGSTVAEGDVVVIMEAMKMETEVRSKVAGVVSAINVKEGGAVACGDVLISL
jgi:oxaloacetate decarboxylase alpha subunit